MLFMAMVAQFHHHDAQMCVKDTLTEGHACQLNPQTFIFTWRSPLSAVDVAVSALSPCQDGSDALVPAPTELTLLNVRGDFSESCAIAAISGDHILRGPPAIA